jgi:very-short-patch-repair endonuclease
MPDLPRRGKRPHQRERLLRKTQTEHERLLWFLLRGRRFVGFKFRRQHRIGEAIVDFVCLESRVAIELDGGQHNEDQSVDTKRDAALAALGFVVLRFWNPQLIDQREDVLDRIWRACVERQSAL